MLPDIVVIHFLNTTPGLKSLFHFSNGQDVGADLSSDGGEVRVLLLQLHQVLKLGCSQQTKLIRPIKKRSFKFEFLLSLLGTDLHRSPAHS